MTQQNMTPQRTTQFLMANLGSEVSRLFAFKRRGEIDQARTSAERALKITTALEHHPRINGGRKEVEILKDIIKNAFLKKPKYHITEGELTAYFRPFSIRALAESGIV
jgi:hypothetical protein